MRRITRIALSAATEIALHRRQQAVDEKQAEGALSVESEWKGARQTRPLRTALSILKTMAGRRERCMYCCDSHATDIEHFWPKSPYPERMFQWRNFLLCCTECGRFKGNKFPIAAGEPELVDPSVEDPWQFLDFDPTTGNISARFDPNANDWSPRGLKTVDVLQLDRREALAAGYQRTHHRIKALVDAAIQQGPPDAQTLDTHLREADDHGLLGWYFSGTGGSIEPFSTLRGMHPDVWNACAQTFH